MVDGAEKPRDLCDAKAEAIQRAFENRNRATRLRNRATARLKRIEVIELIWQRRLEAALRMGS
jgi:hypothetical protein